MLLSQIRYYKPKRGSDVFITDTLFRKTRLKPILSFIATRTSAPSPSDSGQTTAEYGLIFALVMVTAVVTLIAVGGAVGTLWNSFITAWPS